MCGKYAITWMERRTVFHGIPAPLSDLRPHAGADLGAHEVHAVAVDGLGQTGEALYDFELAENKNMPVVNFGAVSDGVLYTAGSVFVVQYRRG